tara:strand:- start:87 stop:422 length:336 start_codon:yes stop_codon:yes gene_type:complete
MSFFQSEVVRAEMAEISELQEEVYSNVFTFPQMDGEDQMYHIDLLEKLLDKQQVLYTRLSLSDDPQAKKMKDQIRESANLMGLPSNVDMNILFKQMTQMLDMMRKQIDKTS